jgi:hypothetical protein
MGVGDDNAEANGLFAELGSERPAQGADAGARIQYDNFASHTQFHAWGVAPVIDRIRPGRRDGAAHTPEFKPDGIHCRLLGHYSKIARKTTAQFLICHW